MNLLQIPYGMNSLPSPYKNPYFSAPSHPFRAFLRESAFKPSSKGTFRPLQAPAKPFLHSITPFTSLANLLIPMPLSFNGQGPMIAWPMCQRCPYSRWISATMQSATEDGAWPSSDLPGRKLSLGGTTMSTTMRRSRQFSMDGRRTSAKQMDTIIPSTVSCRTAAGIVNVYHQNPAEQMVRPVLLPGL